MSDFRDQIPEAMTLSSEEDNIIEMVPKRKKFSGGGPQFQAKLQDEWMSQILTWSIEKNSLVEICKKVQAKWGVSITPNAVRNRIKQATAERGEATRAVIKQNIGQYVLGDLEILKSKKEELVELSVMFKSDKDWGNYYKAIDRIKDLSAMLFELGGANEKQTRDDAEQAKEDLIAALEKASWT